MASHPHLDYEDDFRGDFPGSHGSRRTGDKRAFGDLDEDEDDVFGHKKGKPKVEESGLGATTGVILSLRESLQTCKDNLAACQTELEAAKSEVKKWHSAFQNEPIIPAGTSPEPELVVNYLQKLKSSEESLKEQLEKAKKREAAFIVTFAKREQEIADLKCPSFATARRWAGLRLLTGEPHDMTELRRKMVTHAGGSAAMFVCRKTEEQEEAGMGLIVSAVSHAHAHLPLSLSSPCTPLHTPT